MIDYGIINDSIDFYGRRDFKRVESPWDVTAAISNITKPSWAKEFTIAEKNKVLVASGEQSFLAMYNKGFLPLGQFQTVTPCFRDEVFTPWNSKYFIKNELIKTDDTSKEALQWVIDVALLFFSTYCGTMATVKKMDDETFDINVGDIEVGSYGIRKCEFLTWIYGTGVAEPRLSRAIQHYGLPSKEDRTRAAWTAFQNSRRV